MYKESREPSGESFKLKDTLRSFHVIDASEEARGRKLWAR
jgi:hypothetical protein